MKKLLVTLLLIAVSWTLAGTTAQASTVHSQTAALAKKHRSHHHKSNQTKHKKHARA